MRQVKVIIVEDHDQMRKLMAEFIERDPELTVVGTAGNGADGIKLIRSLESDVVLLDLIMPGMDGLGVLEQFRGEEGSAICPKFIVVSAVSEEHMIGEAFRMGATYYVMKPFDSEILISRIKAVMRPQGSAGSYVKQTTFCDQNYSVKKREVEAEIAGILHRIGIPAHIRGYAYLKKGIQMALENVEVLHSVTTKLYPAIAEAYDTTPSRVERSMRHAIGSAWDRGESEEREKLFGYTIHRSKGNPTNSEFLAMITDSLKISFGW